MNLVISGPIDADLKSRITALVHPTRTIVLHKSATRFEDIASSDAIRHDVQSLCNACRVDHAFIAVPRRFSDFRLLAIDMDSTLITIECIDELADFAGVKQQVQAITEAAMQGTTFDFAESLRSRVHLLKGLDVDVLRRVYEERVNLSSGANALIDKAKEAGMYTLLLSGGFTYFANRLKEDLSLDSAYANTLKVLNSKLTGRLRGTVFDAAAKEKCVLSTIELLDTKRQNVLVIGDGANDIAMMTAAGTSIGFHAKPLVREQATYLINFGGLDVTLDFLGD